MSETGFFSRWSQRKSQQQALDPSRSKPLNDASHLPSPVLNSERSSKDTSPEPLPKSTGSMPTERAHESQDVQLHEPSLQGLDMQSDYSVFMAKEVSASVRNQALKKLFSNAHFNRMDGMDVYIDDYNQFEALSMQEVAQLQSWSKLPEGLQDWVNEPKSQGLNFAQNPLSDGPLLAPQVSESAQSANQSTNSGAPSPTLKAQSSLGLDDAKGAPT